MTPLICTAIVMSFPIGFILTCYICYLSVDKPWIKE
jgi:hypothetical protein